MFWDEQVSNNSLGAGSATNAPETGGRNHGWQRVQQVKWTSTATNRLLLEAGLGTYLSNWNTRERYAEDQPISMDVRRAMVQVNEQCAATQPLDAFGRGGTCAQNGGIAGLNYRNQTFWNADWIGAHTWNAAATFVSGSNSLKIGYQGAYHADNRAQEGGTNDLTYRFNNGIPNQLTQRLEAYRTYSRVRYNAALRAGPDDARAADDERRAALRPLVELLPRAVDRRRGRALPADAVHVGRIEGRDRLQRHHPARRRGLRRLRQRQDRRQVQRRASISRRPSTATATTRRCCRARASTSRRPAPGPTPTATTPRTAIS